MNRMKARDRTSGWNDWNNMGKTRGRKGGESGVRHMDSSRLDVGNPSRMSVRETSQNSEAPGPKDRDAAFRRLADKRPFPYPFRIAPAQIKTARIAKMTFIFPSLFETDDRCNRPGPACSARKPMLPGRQRGYSKRHARMALPFALERFVRPAATRIPEDSL